MGRKTLFRFLLFCSFCFFSFLKEEEKTAKKLIAGLGLERKERIEGLILMPNMKLKTLIRSGSHELDGVWMCACVRVCVRACVCTSVFVHV